MDWHARKTACLGAGLGNATPQDTYIAAIEHGCTAPEWGKHHDKDKAARQPRFALLIRSSGG